MFTPDICNITQIRKYYNVLELHFLKLTYQIWNDKLERDFRNCIFRDSNFSIP